MPLTTIDQIIHELESIITHCISKKNKAGYFAALYHNVTCQVKAGIINGDFEDGPRMERLDVIFASRFIDAWHAFNNKTPLSQSWNIAFQQVNKWPVLVLQHLLLGINAHINLDLGIAAVETMRNDDIDKLRRDFTRINTILSSLLLDVMKDIQRISPLSSILGLHANNGKSMLINFTIESARDGAWCFAEELFLLSGKEADYKKLVGERDGVIGKLGENLTKTKGLLKMTAIFIRVFEWNNAAKVIEVLRTSKKLKFNETLKSPSNAEVKKD